MHSSASIPLCGDVGSGPVISSSGWGVQHPFGINYTDYLIRVSGGSVMKQGSSYLIWLNIEKNVTNQGIYRATSPDGINWTIPSIPVLRPGSGNAWDNRTIFTPDVVWNGSMYLMYYTGDGKNVSREIGVAYSANGISWTKYSENPIITHGPGAYDLRSVRNPSVIFDGNTYKMWYFGSPQPNFTIPNAPFTPSIEYATSADGLHWSKYSGNSVFTGFTYANYAMAAWPSVIKVNGTYLMAFTDFSQTFGYATSKDGINWTFSNSTNVLLRTNGWHNGALLEPSIILDGSHLLLWYYGFGSSTNQSAQYTEGIGFATCGNFVLSTPIVNTTTMVTTSITTQAVTYTLPQTTTSLSTAVSTVTQTVYPNAPAFEVAEGVALGATAALAIAVFLVWRATKRKRGQVPK